MLRAACETDNLDAMMKIAGKGTGCLLPSGYLAVARAGSSWPGLPRDTRNPRSRRDTIDRGPTDKFGVRSLRSRRRGLMPTTIAVWYGAPCHV